MIKKVLILGSGALKIGEAGEFDYSGSQAIKSLKEEKIETILVNPNIATIQTSENMADKVYFLPVNPYFVEKIIQKEKPRGILLGFGGQTALNCGVELARKGILKKYKVKVLGTQIETIEATEDREKFCHKLDEIKAKYPKSVAVHDLKSVLKAAKKIGYPVMVRIAFALGGLGSGIARNETELRELAEKAFCHAKQILIEEYLLGWKEIEYEVIRDKFNNCITVCNMENFDPMGVHTGESIVVAPSQTLTNSEYHKLRKISIRVIRHLKIIGECNIQFALDTKSEDYRIIEVNARLSRSSALASKATGYPLAFVASKLALGYSLPELSNKVTKITQACFEPALDYCVVKIPRWDLAKFKKVKKQIGSEMKSVGEVMAIGRKFGEALQKAIRMLEIGMNGLVSNNGNGLYQYDDLDEELKNPTDARVFAIASAIRKKYSLDKLYLLTGIDKWFLEKIKNIVDIESELKKYSIKNINKDLFRKAKQYGFSDKQIALNIKADELNIRKIRKKIHLKPVVKQIDTLAAEYPASTNYLYLTYNGEENDIDFKAKNQVIVLGSGPYKIGSSVEFDWCCVNAAISAKQCGYKTIMVNYNPETVSTDYDVADKLYFEELSFETVADIYEMEKPIGMIISMGGQIPSNIAMKCHEYGLNILGTSPIYIDQAENRHKFSKLLDKLKIDQPEWKEVTTIKKAIEFSEKVGYPVLIRPSYVLSGSAMNVALNDKDLESYLKKAAEISSDYPVVISKFITEAKEIEIDAVAKNGEVVIYAISEHIENAGVHSGDATMVFPSQKLYLETVRRIKNICKQIAKNLNITGPFNIQFIAKENNIKVIECNLRASRSFPFVSKIIKNNFISIATYAILNYELPKITGSSFELDYVGVKSPQFSFNRLKGADPTLGVEMASTGEVACLGDSVEEAYLKSILAVGFIFPQKKVLLSIGGEKNKYDLLPSIKILDKLGYKLFATDKTAKFLSENEIKNMPVNKICVTYPCKSVLDYLKNREVDLVINIPNPDRIDKETISSGYLIRRTATDFAVPLVTNVQLAKLFISALKNYKLEDLEIKSWSDY